MILGCLRTANPRGGMSAIPRRVSAMRATTTRHTSLKGIFRSVVSFGAGIDEGANEVKY